MLYQRIDIRRRDHIIGDSLNASASSAPCRRFSANPSISLFTVAGTWPALRHQRTRSRHDSGIGPWRRAQFDQRDQIWRIDRVRDQAARAPGQPLGERACGNAAGRAREHRVGRARAGPVRRTAPVSRRRALARSPARAPRAATASARVAARRIRLATAGAGSLSSPTSSSSGSRSPMKTRAASICWG